MNIIVRVGFIIRADNKVVESFVYDYTGLIHCLNHSLSQHGYILYTHAYDVSLKKVF